AAREPGRAGRRPEQGETRSDEGNFSEEAFRVEHDGDRREGRSGVALGTAVRKMRTLGRCFNEQLSSKTAGVRKDINGHRGLRCAPRADGAPGEGMQQRFLIQGRRFLNAAKEVDLG